MRNKIIKLFKDSLGVDIHFTDEFPDDGGRTDIPAVWVKDGQMMMSAPIRAHEFDIAYVACEAVAAGKGFVGINGKPSEAALVNSWALRRAIELYGSNDRVIEILKENVAWMFSRDLPAPEVAYVLWSRMAAADVMEMIRPIRKARPEVAEMIEKIDAEWHVPEDLEDHLSMVGSPPVPDNSN